MKKYTLLAVPVAIALLSFGIPGNSMADDYGQQKAASDPSSAKSYGSGINTSADDQSIGATVASGNTLTVTKGSDNTKGSFNTFTNTITDNSKEQKSSAKDGSAASNTGNAQSVNADNGGAAAVDGSATVTDATANGGIAVVGDVKIDVRAAVSTLSDTVSHNKLSFGNGLINYNAATGNQSGDAGNLSLQSNKAAKQTNVNAADQGNSAGQLSIQGQSNKDGASANQAQVNIPLAATSQKQDNKTGQASIAAAGSANVSSGITSDGSLDPNGKYGKGDPKSDPSSSQVSLAGAAAVNGAKDSNSASATTKATGTNTAYGSTVTTSAENKASASNSVSGDNTANQGAGMNTATDSNGAFQASVSTTGKYTSNNTQTNEVSLATGANVMNAGISATGITPIAFNSGIQSSIQQSVNVQANTFSQSSSH
jgi:hypothetical protein